MSSEDEQERRARAVALLEANHSFPTEFSLSVIARNDDQVTQAIVAAASVGLASPLGDGAHERRPSAQGKYVSHRLTIWCANAEDVLALFARLQAVDGVITVL